MNTKKLIKYLPLIATALILISIANLFRVHWNFKITDWPNILGICIGAIALIPSWKQAQVASKQLDTSNLVELSNRFDSKLATMVERCDESDIRQDEKINEIRQKLAGIETQFQIKQATYSALIDEMFAMRKELAEHRAQLTLAAGMADMRVQLDRMRSQLRELRKPVS